MTSYGFRPDDFINAYSTLGAQKQGNSTIVEPDDISIHPVFDPDNWIDCPSNEWRYERAIECIDNAVLRTEALSYPEDSEEFWEWWAHQPVSHNVPRVIDRTKFKKKLDPKLKESLKPALRLATRLLDLALPLLWQLRGGICDFVPDSRYFLMYMALPMPNANQISAFRDELATEIADRIMLFTQEDLLDRKRSAGTCCYANSWTFGWIVPATADDYKVMMTVDAGFLRSCCDNSADPVALRERHFTLAATLVHEVAHTMFLLNTNVQLHERLRQAVEGHGVDGYPLWDEPFYSLTNAASSEKPELGGVLEGYLLGGLVVSIGDDLTQLHGGVCFNVLPWPTADRGTYYAGGDYQNVPPRFGDQDLARLKTATVESFFGKHVWTEDRRGKPLLLELSPSRSWSSYLLTDQKFSGWFDGELRYWAGDPQRPPSPEVRRPLVKALSWP